MIDTNSKNLHPLTLTHKVEDIHTGGFSQKEEGELGFTLGELFTVPSTLHELVALHKKNFANNLKKYEEKVLSNNPNYKQVENGVYIHETAQVHSSTIFNTEKGIVVIEKDAKILPFSYVVGPTRISETATVNPHSYISGSYIGMSAKVGGEVAGSVIESYSNKAHIGGLYDAYVGSWVNIGGGTSNSNLKNTYGTIKVSGVETGEQFLGCIICDHVKTAINTSIYTGKVIGVGAHIYGTVTNDVPNFVNYYSKDKFDKIPLDVVYKIAERMMARRDVKLTDEDKNLLELIYKNNE